MEHGNSIDRQESSCNGLLPICIKLTQIGNNTFDAIVADLALSRSSLPADTADWMRVRWLGVEWNDQ